MKSGDIIEIQSSHATESIKISGEGYPIGTKITVREEANGKLEFTVEEPINDPR